MEVQTEVSDTINLFEGSRLSNLVLGSCSDLGIFALLLAVLVTSSNEKRKEVAVAGHLSIKTAETPRGFPERRNPAGFYMSPVRVYC